MKKQRVGNFTVMPFNLPHDTDIECYGYLVEHDAIGKLLFLTDFEYCKYNFSKLKVNHIMLEANYSMDFVNKDNPNYEHVLRGHASIETALNFISTNDNPSLRTVCLLHLSASNSDADLFLQKTKETVKYGANCYIAEKGLTVPLDLVPF